MEKLALTNAEKISFWRGKRVLVTGHTGFKGSWLTLWLARLGARVTGISLPPAASPNLYSAAAVDALCESHVCDVRDAAALAVLVQAARPDIVFHLAAQPLVRASYREPLATFMTNVMGTAHLLEALRRVDSVRVAVTVTTDKVYRENGTLQSYREDDPLGGHDPYSASKAASEIVIASYRDSFLAARNVAVASARSGNVIGGGDWSDDRLIPDAVRAWDAGQALVVRRPDAVRPWQHVLEPLAGYMALASRLWDEPALGGAYNFGPSARGAVTVRELIDMARHAYGTGEVRFGDGDDGPHEANWLTLESGKAQERLGVMPVLTLTETAARTMAWYRARKEQGDARALCDADIAYVEQRIINKSIAAALPAESASRNRKIAG
jgi:CDP-glucose 4,6-dehydratase